MLGTNGNGDNGIVDLIALSSVFGGGLLGNRGWGAGYGGVVAPAATTAIATEIALNPTFQGLQQQIQTLAGQIESNSLQCHLDNGFNNIDQGITSVNQNVSGTSRDTLNSIANLSTAQAAANFTTLSSINGLGRDITAQANQNALQQLNSFNEVGRDNAAAFNQTQMSLAAMAAANAACCCEVKQTIKDDGAATRALINDIEAQRKNVEISDLKAQVSNLNQTNVLKDNNQAQTMTILQHLVPFMSNCNGNGNNGNGNDKAA